MLGRELLTLEGDFEGVDLGLAAAVGVEQEGLGGDGHGDRPVYFLEEVVDYSR